MGRLDGRVAIVTGAGRGIGLAIAERFASEGADVVVSSRRRASVDSAVERITAAGGSAVGVECDTGDRGSVFRLVDTAVEAFGSLDILVNNAQGFGTAGNPTAAPSALGVEDSSEEEWEYALRTGLWGTLWAMKAAFPHLRVRGGKIINFGSPSGQVGTEGLAPYNATKEAIRGLTRTAAREWGRHRINVNVISPTVQTDAMAQSWIQRGSEVEAEVLARIPLRGFGGPADAANLAMFLVSSEADFITGATVSIDSGLVMSA